jgi:hypothetical protein
MLLIFYSATLRRLTKACALNSISLSLSLFLGLSDSSSSSYELPIGKFSVVRVLFKVDFKRVYYCLERLNRGSIIVQSKA